MRWLTIAAFVLSCVAARAASASTERYGVFIGSNQGDASEQTLLYAQRDAQRMFDTFVGLGRVRPQNAVLAIDQTADAVRRVIIDTNRKIRQQIASGGDAVLIVYYSGHGDENSLHLNGTHLDLSELRPLVLSSSATVRMLLLDSCRSGPIPRTKGGRRGKRFQMRVDDRLESSGAVLITASAANEDAQESDALKGSLFTHHLLSGLRGAADTSRDARVSLAEAYSYAYGRTVQSSSQSAGHTQHPTFHIDVKGMGDVVLTEVKTSRKRALLIVNDPGHYLVFANGESGPLVTEVYSGSGSRQIVLRPGQYFVRWRATSHLREGTVALRPGKASELSLSQLRRVEYARVVRKGGTAMRSAHSMSLTYRRRGSVLTGLGPMSMVGLTYQLALPSLTVAPSINLGRSASSNDVLATRTRELQGAMRITRDFDFSRWTLSGGALVGASWVRQTFDTTGMAPPRNGLALVSGLSAGVQYGLTGRFYASATAELLSYIVAQRGREDDVKTTTPLTFVWSAGIGAFF